MYIYLQHLPVIIDFCLFWSIIGNLVSLSRIIEFGVNTEYSIFSSIYVNGRFFRLTSTSNNTSSNCNRVYNDLPIDLYRHCFVSPIKYSYCPPQVGFFERLNFQIILSLLKSCNLTFLLIMFNRFAPALKVFSLSECMLFGFSLLEINFLKLLINYVIVRFDMSSRCTALVTLQENNKTYNLRSFLSLELQYNGPTQSVPMVSNGETCSVLFLGKSPSLGFG